MWMYKDKMRIIIITDHYKIKGEVHLFENSRLTDILNADTSTKDFIPITNATFYTLDDKFLWNTPFVAINRKKITLVMEDEEMNAIYRAREAFSAKRYDETIKWANAALKINPNNWEAYYYAGLSYSKKGDKEKAENFLKKCLTLDIPFEIKEKIEQALSLL